MSRTKEVPTLVGGGAAPGRARCLTLVLAARLRHRTRPLGVLVVEPAPDAGSWASMSASVRGRWRLATSHARPSCDIRGRL